MKPLQILTPSEQLVQYLEMQILSGELTGSLPGAKSLSKELGVNHKTVDVAFKVLEFRGLVRSQGSGKSRSIIPKSNVSRRALKVNILLGDPDDAKLYYMIEIRDKLIQLGHHAVFSDKTLAEMKMNLPRIKKLTEKDPADAWIVQAADREVLEWFSRQPFHAFSLFGRFQNIQIPGAGIMKGPAIENALRQLHALGHRRIVMIVQEEQIMPHPGPNARKFLDTLDELGIPSGRYNLPYWQMGGGSFRQCLDSLFQHTPPTALFIPEASLFIAAQQHLARKGIVAPEGVSMICHDPSPAFNWCHPEISHISYDLQPCIRRVLDWVRNISVGKDDLMQVLSKPVFVRGGTIGPPPGRPIARGK